MLHCSVLHIGQCINQSCEYRATRDDAYSYCDLLDYFKYCFYIVHVSNLLCLYWSTCSCLYFYLFSEIPPLGWDSIRFRFFMRQLQSKYYYHPNVVLYQCRLHTLYIPSRCYSSLVCNYQN